jgi:DNA-directed RNA polymerase delta subunit
MKRFFIKKIEQIKNLFFWTPIIWNQRDFDYQYATDLFKHKLLKIAKFLDSKKALSKDAKNHASRIRMIVNLMDKVYNEEYALEYQNALKKLYGDNILDYSFIKTDDGKSVLKYRYELERSELEIQEINETHRKLFKDSKKKQEKAHKILWLLVEHNIRNWWD